MALDLRSGRGVLMAEGKRLEWAAWGAGKGGPVIVLLHEGLGCVALWRDFPRELAESTGMQVFAYSRAGYGRSDPVTLPRPLDYMTREATAVLPQVLDALDPASLILVGHSDGATIAAEFAGRVSDRRLRGLILLAPHFFTEAAGLAAIQAAGESYGTGVLKARLGKYHDDPDNAFLGWNGAWLAPGFQTWNVSAVIEGWRVPALAIQGADDPYGTPAQVETIRARSPAPVDVVLLDECRHAPHLEQPDRTLAAIAGFCKAQADDAGTSKRTQG